MLRRIIGRHDVIQELGNHCYAGLLYSQKFSKAGIVDTIGNPFDSIHHSTVQTETKMQINLCICGSFNLIETIIVGIFFYISNIFFHSPNNLRSSSVILRSEDIMFYLCTYHE